MDDRFFNAWFPPEATICGRKLRTYSTFHFLTLAAIESPFLQPQGKIQPKDLLAAIRVCEHRFGEVVNLKPRWRDLYCAGKMTRNPALFEQECFNFHQFLNAHSVAPQFWEVIDGDQRMRDLSGPSALILIVSAITKLRFTESQAWDMSMGRLQWYVAEAAELAGSDRRFLDEKELEEADEELRRGEQELATMTENQARALFSKAFAGDDLEVAIANWRKEQNHGA